MDRVKSIGILQRDDSPPFLPPIKSNLLVPINERINMRGSQSTKNVFKSKGFHVNNTGDSSFLGQSSHAALKGGLQGKSYYNHKFEFVKPMHKLKSPDKKKDDAGEKALKGSAVY